MKGLSSNLIFSEKSNKEISFNDIQSIDGNVAIIAQRKQNYPELHKLGTLILNYGNIFNFKVEEQ